jgi:hypothetical protein
VGAARASPRIIPIIVSIVTSMLVLIIVVIRLVASVVLVLLIIIVSTAIVIAVATLASASTTIVAPSVMAAPISVISTPSATIAVTAAFPLVVELSVVAALSTEVAAGTTSVLTVATVELLILRRVPVLEIVAAMVASAHSTASVVTVASSMPTTVAMATVTVVRLLAIGRNHCRLVATIHVVMTATHWAVASTAVKTTPAVERSAAFVAAAPATGTSTSWGSTSLVLWLGLFNIDSASIDLGYRIVLDKVLGNAFMCEGNEAETTGRSRIDIFQDNCIIHLTELHKVVLELFTGELEVQASNKDLAFGVDELDIFGVIAAGHVAFLLDLAVRVWLLDVLTVVINHKIVALLVTTVVVSATPHVTATFILAVMVIGRFDIDSLLHDVMATFLLVVIDIDDPSFDLLSLILAIKAKKHKAETSAPLRHPIPHHNSVLNFTELLKIAL